MIVDTVKESLYVNKIIATKKEIVFVEGDMIIPDSKPDILNAISTSGTVCVYKKEVLNDKIKLDGNLNVFIMYLADDEKDKVRGLNTNLDFSKSINIANLKEGMSCKLCSNIKNLECKVINERKIGIKATIELDMKIYSGEVVEIINEIEKNDGIQMLKENLKVNSLVGMGETNVVAKDTVSINSEDKLAEILKTNLNICDKDIKISYNKILTKAEAEIKVLYLTEDNKIKSIKTKIPIVGFIDIQNVNDSNICDICYEIKNLIIKPNSAEEHSIYVEIEVGVMAFVYEEKQVELIQDLYSITEKLEFNKRDIATITEKNNISEIKQIREKVKIDNINDKELIDVDINPIIQKESIDGSKIKFEGEIELSFILLGNDMNMETVVKKIPFEYIINDIGGENDIVVDLDLEPQNQDFVIQDSGDILSNIDLLMNTNYYKNTNFNIMNEIQTNGPIEEQDYNVIMYIIKEGDTLWNIAKKYGSTIDDIARVNGIENANVIIPGTKIFIPRHVIKGVKNNELPMIEYV